MTSVRGPLLDRARLQEVARAAPVGLELPTQAMLELPERVVQFGTGAFLRGFVEPFIDDANRRGDFAGRIVAIASTMHGGGRHRAFQQQNGLYTLVTRGETPLPPIRVIGAIGRVLAAASDWSEVLACARAPALELVFSNTTEVGIAADPADAFDGAPPASFPGKLTRFLFERALAFDATRGLAVLPCELIEDNGDHLRAAVLTTAARWKLDARFVDWLESSVPFCNTLADRIVPSLSDEHERKQLENRLGYVDRLATVCEPYRLFAIQADARARHRLRFAMSDPAIVLADDVAPYRERKLRLLNGAHTIMASLGLLAHCRLVSEALENGIGDVVRRAMRDEIAPHLSLPDAIDYADQVLARFRNPMIHHELLDIMLQATTKMSVRVVPSIVSFVAAMDTPPPALTLGFASLLQCLRGDLDMIAHRIGRSVPQDDRAARIREAWRAGEPAQVARVVCSDTRLWGADLDRIPGFTALVAEFLMTMATQSVGAAIERATGGVAASRR